MGLNSNGRNRMHLWPGYSRPGVVCFQIVKLDLSRLKDIYPSFFPLNIVL